MSGEARRVVLWRRADEVLKGDGDDGPTFTRAELDRLCARGEADPEVRALVRACLGRPTPALRKGPERVEVKKESGMGVGVVVPVREAGQQPATGRSLAQLDADLAAAVAVNQAIGAEKALARRDAKGAQAIFKAHPRAYEAFQVRVAGREYRVPVEKKAGDPDYTDEIKRAARSGDGKALRELLHKPGGYAQYRRLLAAGELVPPRKAA